MSKSSSSYFFWHFWQGSPIKELLFFNTQSLPIVQRQQELYFATEIELRTSVSD